MRPWLVVQQVQYEGPGLISSEAALRGIELDIRVRERGDPLPSLERMDGLILMGGPMSADDVRDEWNLAADALGRRLPVLGVCLGAQIIAAALGKPIRRGPQAEIGLGKVRVVANDPVLGPHGTNLTVMHWHNDTFDLPAGAVHLATSELYSMQAFRYGQGAYGLQFHVEVDEDLARGWRSQVPAGVHVTPTLGGRHLIGRFFDRAHLDDPSPPERR